MAKTMSDKALLSGACAEDIPYELARRAHSGTSFVPEKRAEDERAGYLSHMREVEKWARGLSADESALREALVRYREGYVKRALSILDAKSRAVSTMITGPANFPTARNRKAYERADKLVADLVSWSKRARAAMRRDLTPVVSREDKIAEMEAERAKIKALNKVARSKAEDKIERMMALGCSLATATTLCKNGGFPAYALRNLGARIRATKKRLVIETERAATPSSEILFPGGMIEDNAEDDRVRIHFDDKPDAEMRSRLKSHGWRWSPRAGAWSRKRTTAAMYNAREIVGMMS